MVTKLSTCSSRVLPRARGETGINEYRQLRNQSQVSEFKFCNHPPLTLLDGLAPGEKN